MEETIHDQTNKGFCGREGAPNEYIEEALSVPIEQITEVKDGD